MRSRCDGNQESGHHECDNISDRQSLYIPFALHAAPISIPHVNVHVTAHRHWLFIDLYIDIPSQMHMWTIILPRNDKISFQCMQLHLKQNERIIIGHEYECFIINKLCFLLYQQIHRLWPWDWVQRYPTTSKKAMMSILSAKRPRILSGESCIGCTM